MGTTAASVTRAVAGLEAELGVQLFIRTTRQVSLTAEGAAVTTRVAPLVDGLDRTLDQVRAGPAGESHLVAAPEAPEALAKDPDCLDPARCLGHCEPGRIEGWALERDGQTRRFSAGHEMSANHGDLLAHLAADGHGVALLPDFQVRCRLASGRLVRVLPDGSVTPVWLSLAYPPFSRLPAPVALFSDFVEARLPAATPG